MIWDAHMVGLFVACLAIGAGTALAVNRALHFLLDVVLPFFGVFA